MYLQGTEMSASPLGRDDMDFDSMSDGERSSGLALQPPGLKKDQDKPSFSSNVDQRERKGILPLFFERASSKFWKTAFDSDVLEKEFERFCVNVDRHRFQTGVLYMAFACLILAVYFGVTRQDSNTGTQLIAGCSCAAGISFAFFLLTKFVKLYRKPREALIISLIFAIMFATAEVVSFYLIPEKDFTYAARFGIATSIILLIYTMIPALPMYMCVIIGLLYSVAHETSAAYNSQRRSRLLNILCQALLHLAIHLMGLTAFFMAQVRKRSTFWRVGQSVVAKRDLEIEKQIKDRMIRWVMPKIVADWLIKEGLQRIRIPLGVPEPKVPFRPFNMYRLEHVSILFADIVGFTKMSSNKTAETLVNLLNDLFGRFDQLTDINNCEKISTLGDCYYCVAGCPEPTPYHAICCVEMGLDIVDQIKKFREETKEDVDMRVGIHTGSVLCGIVGDRRRRFDVWSNDVTLANRMEAGGEPGTVHITEVTAKFLNEEYILREGEGINRAGAEGLKTAFIVRRKNGLAGHKPWQLERKHRDSNSSLRQAYKEGMGKDQDQILKCLPSSACTSPKQEHLVPNDIELSISGSEHEDKEKTKSIFLKTNKNFKVAEDDNIEMGYLARPQSPPSPRPHIHITSQLIKTPLPFQRLNAQLNMSCGLTLNEAFMRDALRASNDQQLVKLMHEKEIQREYFFNPPLKWFALQFTERQIELKYRNEGFKGFKLNPKVTTFASPKIHFFFDVVTSTVMFVFILIVCYLLFEPPTVSLISITPICAAIVVGVLLLHCVKFSPMKACCPQKLAKCVQEKREEDKENSETTSFSDALGTEGMRYVTPNGDSQAKGNAVTRRKKPKTLKETLTSPWVQCHLYGAFLMCLPVSLVFACLHDCANEDWHETEIAYFCNLVIVALLHFCSFTQLSSLMKSGLALIWSLCFLLVLLLNPCMKKDSTEEKKHIIDVIITVCLQIVLVAVLNRIHEEGVRVNYYGDREAAEQKHSALEQKQVADWLLLDMFPRHVSEQLKYKNHCSRNYDNVAVLFATIVNFGEFYEENFAGGIECIRVLHELVADFDRELAKFDDVEKIKTVHGTTFMAASGLNSSPAIRVIQDECDVHPQQHLRNLMDFAFAMQRALNEFNENMLGFRFKLRCGFNAGPVTAGVIGTTKPQYDIWGDTVNVSSRMDSTGVPDRIQVTEETKEKLKDFFTFEHRGTIFVKGKNNVTTYYVKDRIETPAVLRCRGQDTVE